MLRLKSISQINEGYTLQGTGFELDTDYVVSAVGRIPNVESLHLENAGVDYSNAGSKSMTIYKHRTHEFLPVEMYWIRNNLN